MGLFNRRNEKPVETRAQEIAAQPGRGAGARFDLTGLWAPRIDGHAELSKLRPDPDSAVSASSIAARCIDLLVQSASSRQLEIVSNTGEPVDHPLENLFNVSPNGSQSALLFRTTFWLSLYTRGQAFVILDRGKSRVDEPRSATVHHGRVSVVITDPTAYEPHGRVLGYRVQVGDGEAVLAPSEVLWFRFPDPGDPWKARAPITAALDAIGLSRAARGWQAGQLANGANPSGIVYVGQPASDEDYDAAREEMEAALTGPSSAGRIATVGGPVKPEFIRTGFNAAEVGYLDTLAAAGEDIALALGVPLDLVGGQRTYSNVEASERLLWTGAILPRLELVASEIDRQLLAGSGLVARFSTADIPALRDSQDSVVARARSAAETDLITLDEARGLLGFDPLPAGAGEVMLSEFRAGHTAGVLVAPGARSVVEVREAPAPPVAQEAPEAPVPELQVRGIDPTVAGRTLDRLEEQARRAVSRLAAAQRKDALKRLNRGRRDAGAPPLSSVFQAGLWLERAYDYLLPAIAAAMDEGAAATALALGTELDVTGLIGQAASQRAEILAGLVNATTEKIISDKLAAAATVDSLSVAEFAGVLDAAFDDLSGRRADTIARTEMVAGLNRGNRAAAVASTVAVARIWVAAEDSRVRPEHAELNGYRTAGMDDPYPNGLLHPGDPSGDPGETINCRCVENYVTPSLGGGRNGN